MNRITLKPRENWQTRLEDAGCFYHTIDGKPYWSETAAYEFTAAEVDKIEDATNELHQMCMDLCSDVVQVGDYPGYGFPDEVKDIVATSWLGERDPHLLGRFDLGYDGKDIKMFEYNADTPTALPEAAIWQWRWLEDRKANSGILGEFGAKSIGDQFNSIHEALVAHWPLIIPEIQSTTIHFAAQQEANHEDWGNLHYLIETATEAGCPHAVSLNIDEIGWSDAVQGFTDSYPRLISHLFKLYPWEWMMADEYGWRIKDSKTQFIEPAWKMLLSTKAILPLLSKRHPGHPLLLPAWFEGDPDIPRDWTALVRKPLLGREGANVDILRNDGKSYAASDKRPEYNKHGYILQEEFKIPAMTDTYAVGTILNFPVIGSWVIGDKACGMGIREDTSLITTNASQFVPHYFVEG